ncbi:hypothetical protein QVG61_03070 [Thiohalobacter sp. IOR34]|uniref:hypothetical protein n=1 Tax=Thiohalobacter sp. IOR34 TaxID=3057176 RepID=UPI0025AEF8C3|nr:hypothetical protein [Thiohalobacter sp. IOR34]WJW76089.1 hypothetical protein QVG61_03070 [Thiohalobacter sp. IOR34]
MNQPLASRQKALLERLIALARRLYAETADFRERPDQLQLWYNRGYANGMLDALQALGHGAALDAGLEPDGDDPTEGQALLGWGQAYRHGWETGRREALEVMESAP